ncbi:hypothetical protein LS482_13925 [Sinomicrobium kalidii]|uniref:hypothetical protein n=1 Tax=Sinomicrobium kalidii TaxID=2900738 RepID=UPI001E377E43|nr:hypothetical protein [Sinomicrobium kalidii]UGU14790.1 hypothetical protein LS482_13925 [Sinomicrobium kalidii]
MKITGKIIFFLIFCVAGCRGNQKGIEYFEDNSDYFIREIDVDKNGTLDKVVSSEKYKGNELYFFVNKGGGYQMMLESINFSEDGGRIIGDIEKVEDNEELLRIHTFFPDGGTDEAYYYVTYINSKWILTKTRYINNYWQEDDAKTYVCDVIQGLNMKDLLNPEAAKMIKQIPDRSERERVCKVQDAAKEKLTKPGVESDSLVYELNNELKAVVKQKDLRLVDKTGKLLGENNSIIRITDESGNCFSEGFRTIVSKGDYFTVEQQNCSNKYIIDEYITFKYDSVTKNYMLHKLGFVYSDKANPDTLEKEKIFSAKDFGKIKFSEFNLDSVYTEYVNK